MEICEHKTKKALLEPKRGDRFSEMLHYWCCVISVKSGMVKCIEGISGRLAVTQYGGAEELEERYRYRGIEGHFIAYHDSSESNAKMFEEAFVAQQESKGDKRDAIMELIL